MQVYLSGERGKRDWGGTVLSPISPHGEIGEFGDYLRISEEGVTTQYQTAHVTDWFCIR
jgi:hypothetical protein